MKIFIYLAAIICAIGLASCSKTPTTFTRIDDNAIYALVHKTNQIEGQFFEYLTRNVYAVPTTKWVNDVFTPRLYDYLRANGELTYQLELNDCVKYSAHGVSVAYSAYAADPGHDAGLTLAVGRFTYVPGAKAHVLLFFIVNDGGGNRMLFYEPQTRQEVELSWEDKLSCYNWQM
jgi:hypothetical protein